MLSASPTPSSFLARGSAAPTDSPTRAPNEKPAIQMRQVGPPRAQTVERGPGVVFLAPAVRMRSGRRADARGN